MTTKKDPILIDVPMPIYTPRLRIEPVAAGHGAASVEAFQESLESFRPWMGWIHEPDALEVDAREKWLRAGAAAFIRRETLFMLAFERASGCLVAGTGYHGIDWDVPKFEIGYWVRQSAQGQGYAYELSAALLQYAFRALNAARVEILVTDGNDKSRRVIERTGIPYEGMARHDHRGVDGALAHTHIYAATDIHHIPEMEISW